MGLKEQGLLIAGLVMGLFRIVQEDHQRDKRGRFLARACNHEKASHQDDFLGDTADLCINCLKLAAPFT